MRSTGPQSLRTFWSQVILLLGSVLMLYPFVVMIVISFPHGSTEAYSRLFQTLPMGWYTWNSFLVAVLSTIGTLILSAMAGYGFARLHFKGKSWLFFLFLITLMVPPQVNMVPLFFLMKQFHWLNTMNALVIPGIFSAFGVFLMRQWFQGFPKELEEAAYLDGCSVWQTFWWIAFPLAAPAVATLGIFAFINAWNSFMWPLVVTHSDSVRTLPVGLATLKASFRDIVDWPVVMAGATVSILPVVLVFLIGQKAFIKGIMSGASKE
ncbi:MAG: carbohydrate ABC transporter permease [Cyanobacteria bacterium]|nr:carbohydrate ABC transporter permease [Cyanobacteriota bacterium]